MIYPTLKECLEKSQKEGILRVEALSEDEYVYQKLGFKPSLISLETKKDPLFFSFFPLFNLKDER